MHDLRAFCELQKNIFYKNYFIPQPASCNLQFTDCGSLKFIICEFFISQPMTRSLRIAKYEMREHFCKYSVSSRNPQLRDADCGGNLINLFCSVVPQPANCGCRLRKRLNKTLVVFSSYIMHPAIADCGMVNKI